MLMSMKVICGLAALVVLGAIYIWAPVCDQLIPLQNGNMTHMRCFYTAQAATYLAILLLACSVVTLAIKNGKTAIAIISLIIGIMLITITMESIGIGVCKKTTMSCIQTAVWLKGCGIVAIIASAVQFFIKK